MSSATRLALSAFTVALMLLTAPSAGAQAPDHTDMAAVGKALANPVSDVWALFTEFDLTFSDGDVYDGDTLASSSMIFQPIMPIPLSTNWKIITRPTIPVLWNQPVPSSFNPTTGNASFDRVTGLGDSFLPLVFSPKASLELFGGQLVGGLGPTWTFPTATDSRIGSKQFEVGPSGIIVWKNDKVTLGAFPQYWWSFAEVGSGGPDTSHMSLLYFMFFNLPNAWQIGFNPSITYDNEASSDNQWNVPIGITVAKTTSIAGRPFKFQFGAEYSVVNQDDFGKRWLIKLNIIPVVKPLIKKALF